MESIKIGRRGVKRKVIVSGSLFNNKFGHLQGFPFSRFNVFILVVYPVLKFSTWFTTN